MRPSANETRIGREKPQKIIVNAYSESGATVKPNARVGRVPIWQTRHPVTVKPRLVSSAKYRRHDSP